MSLRKGGATSALRGGVAGETLSISDTGGTRRTSATTSPMSRQLRERWLPSFHNPDAGGFVLYELILVVVIEFKLLLGISKI